MEEGRYFIIDQGETYEIEGPDLDSVCDWILEDGDDWEERTGVSIEDIPACSEPHGVELHTERLDEVMELLKDERFTNKYIHVFRESDKEKGKKDLVVSYTLSEVSIRLYEMALGSEWGAVYNVRMGTCQLELFLSRGKWNFGLMDADHNVLKDPRNWPSPSVAGNETVRWENGTKVYKPVLWFGLEGETPIECWMLYERNGVVSTNYVVDHSTIEPDDWKHFWFGNGNLPAYEMIWPNADMYCYWIEETGMDKPWSKFGQVRAACPIPLTEEDSSAEMAKKVREYCLRMQKKCILEETVMNAAYEVGKKLIEKIKKDYSCDEENIEDFLNRDQFMLSRIDMAFEDYMADNFFRDERVDCLEIDEDLFGNEREGSHASGNNWNILDRYFKDENEVWIWVMKGWNEAFKEMFGEKYDYDFEADLLEHYGW